MPEQKAGCGRGWAFEASEIFSPSVTSDGLPLLDGAERMESSDFVWVSAGIVDSLHFRGAAPKIRGGWSLMDRWTDSPVADVVLGWDARTMSLLMAVDDG